ncbi:MAG TPA: hypothetical protein VET65_05065 [Candidatus Limnocylindrales bacterium]|nr:hypothetical protein [Candidatus Limnocylindrales bacterium]
MRRTRFRWTLALIALGALLEPLGHQVAYTIHYGLWQALQLESQGSHAYFPGLAATAAVAIGLSLAFALLALGTVRLALGPQRVSSSGSSAIFLRLAASQTVIFVIQETFEALYVHRNPHFLVIGLLALAAQPPVAALAAWMVALLAGYVAMTPQAIRVILAIRIPRPAQPLRLRPQPIPVLYANAGDHRWLQRRGPPRSR